MSDQIPFHIQEEILKRLSVKSLVQFRCVSKAWKSLIDSSEFIAAHSLRRHTHPQHLLVSNICFVDDDTFPQQSTRPTLPLAIELLPFPKVVGSSHGLLCLYGIDPNITTQMAVLWNPSIEPFIGFGVCPVTGDLKLVSIIQSWDDNHIETSYRCEVMVYTLSLGKWRSLSTNLPTKPFRKVWSPIVTDRFIYWNAGQTRDMIVSFDVTNETFEAIDLPAEVASYPTMPLSISKIRESLAILDYNGNIGCIVWMMEDGVQRSFTKLFTVELTPHDFIMGFRKNGVPLIQTEFDELVVYEPNSKHDTFIEISTRYSFGVHSYAESLLLLGQC